MARILTRRFFAQDPLTLAPALLNKLLVVEAVGARARERTSVRLVEVEAYCGSRDPGSHAYRGRTARNATMFGPPGHLYVYFTYGMHWCANVVAASAPGDAGAVLLRAGVPQDGMDVIRARRPAARRERDLTAGPARLTQALGLDGRHDGIDVAARGAARAGIRVRLVDDGVAPPGAPGRSARIGLASGRGDDLPWRFYVAGDPFVSGSPRT